MTGLMEQIRPESKRVYDTTRFPLHAYQNLASNIRTYLVQEGRLLISDVFELEKLIYSEDIESVKLAIYIMETKSGEEFTFTKHG